MEAPIFKAARLEAATSDDPYTFTAVASTPARDRYGDVVAADWLLDDYKKNSVVLWGHDAGEIVGSTLDIGVKASKLIARMRLAAEGTSPRVDNLRRLAEQNLLRAVSVGFRPGKADVIKGDEGEFTGYRFSKNLLLEISIVSVPAHPDALIQARGLNLSDDFAARYFAGHDPAPFLSRKRAFLQSLRRNPRT